MIIDTHTHFYDPTRPQGVPWPPKDNKLLYRTVLPEHFRSLAEPDGVRGTVVVEASAWLEDNQWVLDLMADEPFLLGLVGHINPDRPAFSADLERFADHPFFLGIRCGGNYFEDVERGTFLPDMEALADRDLELDTLIRAPQFKGLIKLAQTLPHLRIVVDHIAHMPIDGAAVSTEWQDHYRQLAAHPNVFMKVSAVLEQSVIQPAPIALDYYRPALDALWDAFGPERLIYGSNWPVVERAGRHADALKLVKSYFAEKGESASARYFWKNAKAVYKWAAR